MQSHWIKRRAHSRRLRNGGTTYVQESWERRHLSSERRGERYRQKCSRCGAHIISVHMPNGGWAHFEGAKGLTRIKHPCLHLGEGLGRDRDDKTLDLFDQLAKA